eukprot:2171158-Pleurochrysis_carterae.AAC.2
MASYNVGDFVQVMHPPLGIEDESCKILRKNILGISGSYQLQRPSAASLVQVQLPNPPPRV